MVQLLPGRDIIMVGFHGACVPGVRMVHTPVSAQSKPPRWSKPASHDGHANAAVVSFGYLRQRGIKNHLRLPEPSILGAVVSNLTDLASAATASKSCLIVGIDLR